MSGRYFKTVAKEPKCDITGTTSGLADGKIDIRDIATVAKHFGEIDP